MGPIKSDKSVESNKKRLESLNEKLNDYQSKKNLIRSSLKNLDSANQKPKKIIFSDNDDEDAEEELPVVQNPIVKRQIQANNNDDDTLNETQEKKKFKLIDSDSDDDDDNEKTIKAFESKVNIDQKRANRLIYLKTKFSNDDQRFKIDQRFMEDDDQNDSVSKQSDDDDESSKRIVAVDEDDDDSDAKPAKVKKKEIKKENLNSLKILEQITGKQILKPTSADMEQKSLHGKKKSTTQRMIRYDPTKIEHKKYELTGRESSDEDSDDDDDDDSSSSDESEKEKKTIENDEEKNKTAEVVQDTSKFYHVEPNLKSLFSSNDVFKFKFSNDHETDVDKSGSNFSFNFAETKSNKLKSSILDSLKRPIAGTNVYASSSEDEYDHESETDELDNHFDQKKSADQSDTKKAARRVDGDWQRRDVIEIKSFLPDFDNDKELKDALKYFCRSENIDTEEFRKEWLAKREKLVQECKKKNKRMLRIKRIKENQKLLPWKSNKSVSGVNRHLNFNSSNGYATSSVNYNKTNSNNRKKV